MGLTWADVDLDAGELTIDRQLQRVGAELLHRDGDSFLRRHAAGYLHRGARQSPAYRDAAGPSWQPSPLDEPC
ncbi:hypothetical protein AB0283_17350 [Micromonospora vinacea]|uniref:hypothetical protein n=1 Tax=Micromonospora vinacea TaxID=709878 RepID=UPI00344D906C